MRGGVREIPIRKRAKRAIIGSQRTRPSRGSLRSLAAQRTLCSGGQSPRKTNRRKDGQNAEADVLGFGDIRLWRTPKIREHRFETTRLKAVPFPKSRS